MAKRSGADLLVLLWGGYDLRPDTNSIPTWTHEAVIEDTTPFGVADQQQTYAGMRKGMFEVKGFYDDAALATNAALLNLLGATAPLCVGPAGNTVGAPFFGCQGVESSYQRQASVAKVTYVDAKLTTTGEVDEGQIQQPLGAVTANGNSTSIDGGAATTNGLVGYLQVPALSLGTATSLTVTLQDSADGTTFANIAGGGFTAISASITTTPVAQRIVISGTIRRYTRALWSFGGTVGGGTTATIFVGIYRGATQAVSAVEPPHSQRRRTVADDDAALIVPDEDSDLFAEPDTAADAASTHAHKRDQKSREDDKRSPATAATGDAPGERPPRRSAASPVATTAADTDTRTKPAADKETD